MNHSVKTIQIETHKVLRRKANKLSSYVVACSGGLDSMVLLDVLAKNFRYKTPNAPKNVSLIACYIDHGIRNDTAKDRNVIEKYCKKFEIEFIHRKVIKHKNTSEASLRKLRYDLLFKICKKRSAPLVTAHHADDVLETYLIKLLRGTDKESFKGIAQYSVREQVQIIRPFLSFSKADLIHYSQSEKVNYYEDSTNLSSKYLRNRIRNELLPLIEDIRPHGSQKLKLFLDQMTKKKRKSPPPRKVTETLEQLKSKSGIGVQLLEFSLLEACIFRLFSNQKIKQLKRTHFIQLKSILEEKNSNTVVLLPNNFKILVKNNIVFLV